MLKLLAPRIWATPSDKTAFGLDIGTRMTVIDIDGQGTLFIHSPVKIESALLNAIGKVQYVVLPNKWRRSHIAEFRETFPEARFFGAPDLEKLEKQIKLEPIPSESAQSPWGRSLDHLLIQGSPFFNEVAFLHRSSKTLILADLGGFMYDEGPLTSQLALKLLKSGKSPGWSTQEKKLYIRDRQLFAKSIEEMLKWDFVRVIVAHGQLLDKGRPMIEQAFQTSSL
jgi:hypothetical protein